MTGCFLQICFCSLHIWRICVFHILFILSLKHDSGMASVNIHFLSKRVSLRAFYFPPREDVSFSHRSYPSLCSLFSSFIKSRSLCRSPGPDSTRLRGGQHLCPWPQAGCSRVRGNHLSITFPDSAKYSQPSDAKLLRPVFPICDQRKLLSFYRAVFSFCWTGSGMFHVAGQSGGRIQKEAHM